MRKKIKLIAGTVLFLLAIFMINRVISSSDTVVCKDFRIDIPDVGGEVFVTAEELKFSVRSEYHELHGTNISEIDLGKVKQILEKNPFVKRVRVYKSLDGEVIAEVEQRVPIIRVFNTEGKAFMIDESGDIMPVPEGSALPLICAGGQLVIEPDSFMGASIRNHAFVDQPVFNRLNSVFIIAGVLRHDPHFSDLFSQIYVNGDNEIELIPVVGDVTFFFGLPEQAGEKLDKLHIFYTELFPYLNIDEYKRIDLTISNQIVMQKK